MKEQIKETLSGYLTEFVFDLDQAATELETLFNREHEIIIAKNKVLMEMVDRQWISVSEDLPKPGLCIVQYYNPLDTAKRPYVIPLWRGRSGWYYDNSETERADDKTLIVTHYQPLPPPISTPSQNKI